MDVFHPQNKAAIMLLCCANIGAYINTCEETRVRLNSRWMGGWQTEGWTGDLTRGQGGQGASRSDLGSYSLCRCLAIGGGCVPSGRCREVHYSEHVVVHSHIHIYIQWWCPPWMQGGLNLSCMKEQKNKSQQTVTNQWPERSSLTKYGQNPCRVMFYPAKAHVSRIKLWASPDIVSDGYIHIKIYFPSNTLVLWPALFFIYFF